MFRYNASFNHSDEMTVAGLLFILCAIRGYDVLEIDKVRGTFTTYIPLPDDILDALEKNAYLTIANREPVQIE